MHYSNNGFICTCSLLSCLRTGHREHVYFISDVKSGWTKQEAISMLFVVKYQAGFIKKNIQAKTERELTKKKLQINLRQRLDFSVLFNWIASIPKESGLSSRGQVSTFQMKVLKKKKKKKINYLPLVWKSEHDSWIWA